MSGDSRVLYHVLRWLADRLVPRRYLVVRADPRGPACVMEPESFVDFCDGADSSQYISTTVWMTRYGFDNLPDFGGF